MLETKRTWGREVGGFTWGADRWSWNSFEIVSRRFFSFLFFFTPSPFEKKEERSNGEKKHGEKERERESASQSKVSKKYQEAGEGGGVERRRRKQTGRSSPVEKLRTEMNPSKWTGAFYGPPFLLDRLRDFSEAYIRTSRRKSSITKTPGFGEQFPRPSVYVTPLPFPHFCRVTSMKRQVISKRNRFFAAKWMVIHWWFYSVYYERLKRTLSGRDYAFLFEDQANSWWIRITISSY